MIALYFVPRQRLKKRCIRADCYDCPFTGCRRYNDGTVRVETTDDNSDKAVEYIQKNGGKIEWQIQM